MIKVSIVTVTYNSASTIRRAIESVLAQDYKSIEYIIIDGNSTDSTLDIIREFEGQIARVVSEPDKGIYDAMNKGIALATGDIVGILNSDDYFSHASVVSTIVNQFDETVDAVYGDVQFVSASTGKVVRYFSSKKFRPSRLKMGLSPAHPSFYVKREYYERYGNYNTDYRIAADFDLFARFFQTPIRYKYIQEPLVTMRHGGISTRVGSKLLLNREVLDSCRKNGIRTNWLMVLSRYFWKILELRC